MIGGGKYDLLLVNGLVMSRSEDQVSPLMHGYVAVKDGVIAAVGPASELGPLEGAAQVIDAAGGLIMPGLVNGHVHCPMTLFRGLADDLPLMTWLTRHIFPAESAHVGEELVYWGTKLACAEMLLSGTTCLADGYFLEKHAARAVLESGLRAVLGQGVIDFPAPGVPDPSRNIDAARDFIQEWQGVSPLLSPSVFCHSPYTCSSETLVKAKALARATGALFQIHVSETEAEVNRIKAEKGLRPVAYLDSLGLLDQSTLAVHCVHLDQAEIDLLAERKTPVCVCVESQMKLASGLAPLEALLKAGLEVALGTDGPASNNDLNMFGEMRSTALLFKVAGLNPTALPASQVLDLAGPRGAAALGFAGRIGSLLPGFRADVIVLDLDRPNLHPLYHPVSHLVYAATGREVKTVMVNGRVLVRDGRFLAFDLEETMNRVREIARRIRAWDEARK
ncbi:MAG: amidohydrolase [Thermodesulfobacteriota bacterium]